MSNSSIPEFKPKGNKISIFESEVLNSLGFKWCPKCKTVKVLEEFSKSNTRDGYNGTCKSCVNIYRDSRRQSLNDRAREYYQENRDAKIQWARQYRESNSERVKLSKKTYYENNKEKILDYSKQFRLDNLDRYKEKDRLYNLNNRAKKAKQNKEYRQKTIEKYRDYIRNKYNTDLEFKLRRISRGFVRRAFLAINTKKSDTTRKLLGYSPIQLKAHIESQFKEGMTWDNYGEWHIDHIIPISSANTLAEAIELSQLNNLQPLWGIDNIRKSNKF